MEESILIKKYFPTEWDQLILPSRILQILDKKRNQIGYRLLLFGSPGTGKTTTSRLITKGHDVLYLSGSNDFTIDIFRSKVMQFSTNFSIMGKQKTIIIDESENIKNIIQDAFKILLDKSVSVNYIFITNEIDKIIEPLRSRFTQIDYDFNGEDLDEQKKKYINYIINICKTENISYENSGIKMLFQINFPDIRHSLINLQDFLDSNESLTIENIKKLNESGKRNMELYNIIENLSINGKEYYETIVKFQGKEKECFLSLGNPYFEYLNEKNMFDKTLDASQIISKYGNMYLQSINPFITFYSCINELRTLFR